MQELQAPPDKPPVLMEAEKSTEPIGAGKRSGSPPSRCKFLT